MARYPLGKGATITLAALEFVPSAELVVHESALFVTLGVTGEAKVQLEFGQLATD